MLGLVHHSITIHSPMIFFPSVVGVVHIEMMSLYLMGSHVNMYIPQIQNSARTGKPNVEKVI